MLPPPDHPPVRALSFGAIAELYERYRMGYPEDLLTAVLSYAGRPVRRALEVGAGTGKATRLFAGHGIQVTALEPDADMAAVLRRTVAGLPVRALVVAFEAFRTASAFELLYAGAAWHWTDPAVRWARAAELLEPGGVLALFGRSEKLADPALAAAVDEVEHRVLPDADEPAGTPWTAEDVERSGGFADVADRRLPATARVDAERLVQRVGTSSAYLLLGPDARAGALRAVRAVLPDEIELDTTVQLTLARRV